MDCGSPGTTPLVAMRWGSAGRVGSAGFSNLVLGSTVKCQDLSTLI